MRSAAIGGTLGRGTAGQGIPVRFAAIGETLGFSAASYLAGCRCAGYVEDFRGTPTEGGSAGGTTHKLKDRRSIAYVLLSLLRF